MQKLLNYNGRPCEIERSGRRRAKNPKWGHVHFSIVRYLDGGLPARDEVTAGKLKLAKPIRETETIYWRRVDDLVRAGMAPERAKEQARAELSKGILADAAF